MPTNTTLKAAIDAAITNKTADDSITPHNVGDNMKATIDYTDQELLTTVRTTGDQSIDDIKTFTSIPIAPGFKTPDGDGSGYLMDDGTISNGPSSLTPPLDKINEGSGLGIMIRGRNSSNYGNIGLNAVDLSFSEDSSGTYGATGERSFTSGYNTKASGRSSSAFGEGSFATGINSSAKGLNTRAIGNFSSSEGVTSEASGIGSHSEGSESQSTGAYSHAQGSSTIASGNYSHSEGTSTRAIGENSHAEGVDSYASGDTSHAEGRSTIALGNYSHAGGIFNESNSYAETSIGSCGTAPTGTAGSMTPLDRVFNVGNGSIVTLTPSPVINRSDAFTILKNGLATLPSVTNTLISNGSNKSIITKEYLVANNLQKSTIITSDYTLLDLDHNTTIFVDTTSTAITITITGITIPNFCVGIIHKAGSNDITFVGVTNPVGLKSKGEGYQTFIERELSTSNYYLLGNTKV